MLAQNEEIMIGLDYLDKRSIRMYGVSCMCWRCSVVGERRRSAHDHKATLRRRVTVPCTALRSPLAQFSTALVPQNTFPREETTFQMFYYLASCWTRDQYNVKLLQWITSIEEYYGEEETCCCWSICGLFILYKSYVDFTS